MKIGAENRKALIIACALMAFGMFLFVRMVRGWSSVAASAPMPKAPVISDFERAIAPNAPAAPASRQRTRSSIPLTPTLDPRLRLNLLAQSEDIKYEGTGRNIFDRESLPPIPQPLKNGKKEPAPVPAQPAVYTPPPPPPIPLKFFGFANSPGEPKQAFLSQGEDVFIAKEGDIVNRRYKIVRIGPASIEIEDLLSNSRQTLPLMQG